MLKRDGPTRLYRTYCIQKLDFPGHVWLPLNRGHKPLGVPRDHWVDYEDFALQAFRFSRDPAKFSGIFVNQSLNKLWLFDDDRPPDLDYYNRLGHLELKAHREVTTNDLRKWRQSMVHEALLDVKRKVAPKAVLEVLASCGVQNPDLRLGIWSNSLINQHRQVVAACKAALVK